MSINSSNNETGKDDDTGFISLKRRRRKIILLASLTLAFFGLIAAQVGFNALEYYRPSEVWETLILYVFSTLNFLGFVVLLIALIRNIMKLRQEKRQGKLGAKFKWRLVISSISLSLLPVLFMFFVMSGMINRSIEKWFGIAGQQVLESSKQVVDTYLGTMRESLSRDAGTLMRQIIDAPGNRTSILLSSNLNRLQLISVELHDNNGQIINKDAPKFVDESNGKLNDALNEARTKIEQRLPWDFVVYAGLRPVYIVAFSPTQITDITKYSGVILARKVPVDTSAMIVNLTSYIDRYERLQQKSKIVRNSAFITLICFTLIVMFVVFWLSLNIAKSIADPVQKLAIAIDEIKKGDLSYRADVVSDDEFAALALSFNEMAEELAESRHRINQSAAELVEAQRHAAWSEVARRMAHEIKNPLTPIRLSADRLRKNFLGGGAITDKSSHSPLTENETEMLDECTAMIDAEVMTLQRMVDEFSQFAREPNADLKIASINDVVEKTVKLYYDRLNGIKLECKIDNSVPSIACDEEQIKRLLVNLIDNAAEALSKNRTGRQEKNTPEKIITVETRNNPNNKTVELIVVDTGPGIKSIDRERIFELNYSTRKRGTGLGLAIVHRIVMQHHGQIRITDNFPRGAKFIVELPQQFQVSSFKNELET